MRGVRPFPRKAWRFSHESPHARRGAESKRHVRAGPSCRRSRQRSTRPSPSAASIVARLGSCRALGCGPYSPEWPGTAVTLCLCCTIPRRSSLFIPRQGSGAGRPSPLFGRIFATPGSAPQAIASSRKGRCLASPRDRSRRCLAGELAWTAVGTFQAKKCRTVAVLARVVLADPVATTVPASDLPWPTAANGY